jgi:hypothetical protein
LQVAGALDDLYAAAGALSDLGVKAAGGNTAFELWAPTAQKALLCTYDTGSGADSEAQQAAVGALKHTDCFNWGYDPYHFSVPEGSHATDAADGAMRILEFCAMATALRKADPAEDPLQHHAAAHAQGRRHRVPPELPQHRLDPGADGSGRACQRRRLHRCRLP